MESESRQINNHESAKGKIDIRAERRAPRGIYRVYAQNEDVREIIYEGELGNLGDIYITNTIVLAYIKRGIDICFIINSKDLLSFPDLIT